MKKQPLSKASTEGLGMLILCSLCCTMTFAAVGSLSDLFQIALHQIHTIAEGLSAIDAHRTCFPQ